MRSLVFGIFVSFITLFSVNSFAHDVDGDGKIGLAEAIDALQIVAGIKFENTQQLCSDGMDNDGDGNIDCADDECSGMICNDGNGCTQDDTCVAGSCQGVAVICSDTLACTDDVCNSTGATTYICTYIPWSNYCSIDGACYSDGSPNPTNECQVCDAQANPVAWSNGTGACDDGVSCTHSDICVSGVCTGTSYACSDGLACTHDVCNGDGSCTSIPISNFCSIGGACYSDGSPNPTNECQICDVQISQEAWSNETGTCDDGDTNTINDTCQSGVCVGQPSTCNDLVLNGDETDIDCGGSCPPCTPGSSCLIDDDCISSVCDGDICE